MAENKACPIMICSCASAMCIGKQCAWWCEFAKECSIPLLAGMFADSEICRNVFEERVNDMRLGDLDEALRMIKDSRTDNPFTCRENSVAWIVAHDSAISCVKACPTIDAVQVVRCRECKHRNPENHHCDHVAGATIYFPRKDDDFCSYGERKGENTEETEKTLEGGEGGMIGANDGRNHTQIKPVDFHISVKPISIELECPFCHEEITIRWKDITPPEYCGDKWDDIDCPHCYQPIELGDYDYD